MRQVLMVSSLILIAACSGNPEITKSENDLKGKEEDEDLIVRFAKLKIDSAQLDEYLNYLKEGIETSIATEPGVLTMHAVQEERDPSQVTVLEIYASDSAYQSHLKTPHFLRYKEGTIKMVRSLELVDLDPIVFGVR
ncbi:MAG: antibiotic biosynthesis monooxygenase family protein [Cytophagales bacterium]|nr:antibiotic biosynthesis monooxygenase family protein [Cytophagales bacterium]